jgi:hypothetical protein
MSLITARGFALEQIEREVHIILYEQLNEEIDTQEQIWYENDEDFSAKVGSDLGKTFLEHIPDENFYSGHRPSLLGAGKEKFPNICVMCYSGIPTDEIDQMQNWSVDIDLELMIKSEEGEADANRKIHRTAEAVNQVMFRNESLNGYSIGYTGDPDIIITNIFQQSEELTHGDKWWWMGARIGYNIIRNSKLPLGA